MQIMQATGRKFGWENQNVLKTKISLAKALSQELNLILK